MNLESLESKLASRPHSPLFARLASEYLAAGRITEAIDLCQPGLEHYPDYLTAHVILAKCHAAESDLSTALATLQRARAHYPDSPVLQDLQRQWEQPAAPTSAVESPIVEETQAEVRGEVQVEEPPVGVAESEQVVETEKPPTEELVEEAPTEEPLTEPTPEEPARQEIEITSSVDEEIQQDDEVPVAVEEEPLVEAQVEELQEEVAAPAEESIVEEPPIHEEVQPPAQELIVEQPRAEEEAQPAVEEPIIEQPPVEIEETVQPPAVVEPSRAEEPPKVEPPPEPTPAETPEGDWRIVSKTLAEIYASQGAYDEAITTYQLLKEQRPDLREEIDQRLGELALKLHEKLSQS